jgi:hypothetical protein
MNIAIGFLAFIPFWWYKGGKRNAKQQMFVVMSEVAHEKNAQTPTTSLSR